MTLTEQQSPQAIQAEWQAHLRESARLFQSNEAPPSQLHFLASLYFGHSAWANGKSGEDRLRRFLGDDELTMLALEALAAAPSRPDLPSVQDTFDLWAHEKIPYLAWPILAGLEEHSKRDGKKGAPLPDDRLRIALTFRAFYDPASHQPEPEWHQWAVAQRPRLVAETIMSVYRDVLRHNRSQHYGLHELCDDVAYAEVARLSVPSLLRTFPARGRTDQLRMLASVLVAALSHCNEDEFCAIVDSKLAIKSMGAQQKIYWVCAGLLRCPAAYLWSLERELEKGASQRRVRYAAEFLGSDDISRHLAELDHIDAAGLLVKRIGPAWGPFSTPFPRTSRGETVVSRLINAIAKRPDADATALLQDLVRDRALARWHERLTQAARGQREVRRNAEFRYPEIRIVMDALAGTTPANASDLAALAYDELTTLGREIRNGQTSDWQQYWRTECDHQHENDCRDRLLSDLRPRLLRFNVMADKESTYADDKRADIRVSHDCFNVPIEIKLSDSKDLWSAIRSQLIPRYARDPGAAGHGILLVFWFGQRFCSPKAGKRPTSAGSLQASLVDSLPADVSRLVKVLVIDVERPQEQPS